MRSLLLAAGAMLALGAGGAQAAQVSDPKGDFLASFAGKTAYNLDITSFSANFDAAAGPFGAFDLAASFAGAVNEGNGTSFVIGVNTGTGANHPFANIGEGAIAFNQTIGISQSGAVTVGGHALTASVVGDSFSLIVPVEDLTATGFKPQDFTFALWTKTPVAPADQNQFGANSQNADFAPDRMLAAVPEPASWALMITGFGLAGATLRRRRTLERRGVFA